MKNSLFLLLFAIFLFTSCNEDETPQSFLNGTYEIARENTDTGIWYVSRYIFNADGTYERLGIARESENGDDLGFSSYSKGTYSLRGEDFSIRMTESSFINHEEFPDGFAESLEDLEAQEISSESAGLKGILKTLEDGAKISIVFECNDMITSALANCIGEQVYVRVD